jgi:hypothetical protein
MSRMLQCYGTSAPVIQVLPPPLGLENAPTSNMTNFEIGQLAYTPTPDATAFYIYAGAGVWSLFATSGGDIVAINGTANQITATTTAGTTTLSIPAVFIAPGSIASTTTMTAGTGITATTGNITASAGNVSASGTVTGGTGVIATSGNITATAGNFVSSTAGNGLVLNSGTASGTTTATLNGRSGQITITAPTINAGSAFTFTISNTSVTGSGTQILYSMSGGTALATLTIASVTNSANQSVVVIQNTAAVTNSTANIILNFFVIN